MFDLKEWLSSGVISGNLRERLAQRIGLLLFLLTSHAG